MDQKLILIVENKHNVGSKDFNFEFLVDVDGFKLKKMPTFFFKFPWFSYWKTSLTLHHFFPNAGRAISIFNFLLVRPCTLDTI